MLQILRACITEALDEVNLTREEKIPTAALDSIYLYGDQGVFDSMQLVNFLMLVEERIADRLGYEITIASERAVSRQTSPFRSVPVLSDFILEEIELVKAA